MKGRADDVEGVSRAIQHCHYEAAVPGADVMDNGATVTEALEEALRWGLGIPTATSTTDPHMPNGPRTSMILTPLGSDDVRGSTCLSPDETRSDVRAARHTGPGRLGIVRTKWPDQVRRRTHPGGLVDTGPLAAVLPAVSNEVPGSGRRSARCFSRVQGRVWEESAADDLR
jgi:hypothetical protein